MYLCANTVRYHFMFSKASKSNFMSTERWIGYLAMDEWISDTLKNNNTNATPQKITIGAASHLPLLKKVNHLWQLAIKN